MTAGAFKYFPPWLDDWLDQVVCRFAAWALYLSLIHISIQVDDPGFIIRDDFVCEKVRISIKLLHHINQISLHCSFWSGVRIRGTILAQTFLFLTFFGTSSQKNSHAMSLLMFIASAIFQTLSFRKSTWTNWLIFSTFSSVHEVEGHPWDSSSSTSWYPSLNLFWTTQNTHALDIHSSL